MNKSEFKSIVISNIIMIADILFTISIIKVFLLISFKCTKHCLLIEIDRHNSILVIMVCLVCDSTVAQHSTVKCLSQSHDQIYD